MSSIIRFSSSFRRELFPLWMLRGVHWQVREKTLFSFPFPLLPSPSSPFDRFSSSVHSSVIPVVSPFQLESLLNTNEYDTQIELCKKEGDLRSRGYLLQRCLPSVPSLCTGCNSLWFIWRCLSIHLYERWGTLSSLILQLHYCSFGREYPVWSVPCQWGVIPLTDWEIDTSEGLSNLTRGKLPSPSHWSKEYYADRRLLTVRW